MAFHRGSEIVVSSPPRGLFREGTIKTGETPRPGQILQIDASAGLATGTNEWTYEIYSRDADSDRPQGPLFILLPDPAKNTWGLNTTAFASTTTEYIYSAYAAGDHCFVYTPMPGEEFNLLLKDVSGTADAGDNYAAGDLLIIDSGTGKLIETTGTPETEPFMLVDTITGEMAGDILAHVIYTGY